MSNKPCESRPPLRIFQPSAAAGAMGAELPSVRSVQQRLAETQARVEKLQAEHRERRPLAKQPSPATPAAKLEARLGKLAGRSARRLSRFEVELRILPPDPSSPVRSEGVLDALATIAAAGATVRLRKRRLLLECRGARIPQQAIEAARNHAVGIAVLLAATSCSHCKKPLGRIEPTTGRPPSRPWRIICTSCGRRLRLRR